MYTPPSPYFNFPGTKTIIEDQPPPPDYRPHDYLAAVAFPCLDGHGGCHRRLWVRGSSATPYVTVRFSVDGQEHSQFATLSPPHFTKILYVASHLATPSLGTLKVRVSFCATKNEPPQGEIITYLPDPIDVSKSEREFSILAYGGFQPFGVGDVDTTEEHSRWQKPVPYVVTDKNFPEKFPLLHIRRLFRFIAIETTALNRHNIKHCGWGKDDVISKPILVLGNGDQIYLDAAYEDYGKYGSDHPLSAWTKEVHPSPRLTVAGFKQYTNEAYRHFWGFTTLNDVFHQCPSVMTWDDHEIRDGWGSHGDEHLYEDYFRIARDAFAAYQLSRGPLSDKEIMSRVSAGQDLYQIFQLRGVPVFVMDLRSSRRAGLEQVISKTQFDKFREWLSNVNKPSEVVIVSSIPLFLRYQRYAKDFAIDMKSDLRDDILDSWDSSTNSKQWKMIVAELVKARDRGVRPIIVSGDVHQGVLVNVWYEKTDESSTQGKSKSILAYELVTSGPMHGPGTFGGPINNVKRSVEAERLGAEDTFEVPYSGRTVIVDPEIVHSGIYPNFGMLDFKPNVTIMRLYEGRKTNYLRKYLVRLDWEKKWSDDEHKETVWSRFKRYVTLGLLNTKKIYKVQGPPSIPVLIP